MEAVANALDEAKDLTGTITAGSVERARFAFADEATEKQRFHAYATRLLAAVQEVGSR